MFIVLDDSYRKNWLNTLHINSIFKTDEYQSNPDRVSVRITMYNGDILSGWVSKSDFESKIEKV